jgi:peptidyl-prolyl cis-trans isomerase C
MSNTKLTVLGAIAAVLVVWSIILSSTKPGSAIAFVKGRDLLPPYDRDRIARIEIEKEGKKVTMNKLDTGGFVVTSRLSYPADTSKIFGLIANLESIKCQAEISTSKDAFGDLGVDGGKESTVIRLFDHDGKEIVGVVAGKNDDTLRGDYVRLTAEDKVYASTEPLSFDTEDLDYLNKRILKVDEKDIAKVQVKGKDRKPYVVESPKEGETKLLDIPAGKRGKNYDYQSVFRAATDLSFEDFKPESEMGDLAFDTTYTVTKRFQPSYDFFIAKKDDKYWLKCKAVYRGPDWKKVISIKGDESKEDTERKDKLIESRKEVDRFNSRHQSWVYQIPSWTAQNMTKKFDELVEEVISASHILIGYEGADRSTVKGRTKEQAKKIAEDLLVKVKAEPDKFGDFAKEHSDGPSKDKAGDLGEFNRETMEKPFTEAAFKLKVGEISDVVETKFGFHIIKRTK